MKSALALLLLLAPAITSAGAPPAAVIAIIIDDLGNSLPEGRRVVALPGPVACAILPHTEHGPGIAELAYAARKEVLLHLPMESLEDSPLGAGGITLDMNQSQIREVVQDDLASLPHLTGVNNHEGSLITQHPGDMAWIMQALHAAGNYFYIDSYTTPDSVAYSIAREQHVPAARRNVFLDDVDTAAAVRAQWAHLLRIAHERGFALAIGHPRAATLAVLEAELPQLAAEGVELVAPSQIVNMQEHRPLPDTAIPAAAAK